MAPRVPDFGTRASHLPLAIRPRCSTATAGAYRRLTQRSATMEEPWFGWPGDDNLLDFRTPVLPRSQDVDADVPVEQNESPDEDTDLPLLRYDQWDEDKQYDKNSPECIHYDFRWKVSRRGNIRARDNWSGSFPDSVLAPSELFKRKFRGHLDALLNDKEKFPGEKYVCVKTNVNISIERTRGRGLNEEYTDSSPIDWNMIDGHLEGLGALFSKGTKMDRKITFAVELVYKEDAKESSGTRKQKQKRSETEAQHAALAKERGIWKRVYAFWRCRASHCKHGPHCYRDKNGNHHKLEAPHLKEISKDVMSKMKDGEKPEEVEITSEVPIAVLEQVLGSSRKRKADALSEKDENVVISGDSAQRLEQFCNHLLSRTESDRCRRELQRGIQWAEENCLDLNSVPQHTELVVREMLESQVKIGVALQLVNRAAVKEWWRIQQETEQVENGG